MLTAIAEVLLRMAVKGRRSISCPSSCCTLPQPSLRGGEGRGERGEGSDDGR